jgi:FAD:protein FMN transferase
MSFPRLSFAQFLVLLVSLTGHSMGASESVVVRARYLMGTVCEISASKAEATKIDAAFAEAERIERLISTWRDDSELSRLNAGTIETAGEELEALLVTVFAWKARTGGAFDPEVKALVDVWRSREEGHLPEAADLQSALRQSAIEEGAFGKGYALDRMLALFNDPGAAINFGGQLVSRGPLQLTIADPARRDVPVLALSIEGGSVSTSSGSEKTFELGGRRYSHIFDPRTGEALPPRGSVTVISGDALTADVLSTALYVMGEEDALRWADANGVAAIVINPQRQIRFSAAARERAHAPELLDGSFSMKE